MLLYILYIYIYLFIYFFKKKKKKKKDFNNTPKRISSILSQIRQSFSPISTTSSKKKNSLLRLSIQNNYNNKDKNNSNNHITFNKENNNDDENDGNDDDNGENGGENESSDRKKMRRSSSGFSTATTSSNFSNFSTLSGNGSGSKVKLYLWKQTNYFFINSTNEYVSVGSGGGTYGLWFDQQMLHGRSQVCETFKNDILSTQENFEIVDMELWSFTTQVEREVARTRPSAFSVQK